MLQLKSIVSEEKDTGPRKFIKPTFKTGDIKFSIADLQLTASKMNQSIDNLIYVFRTRKSVRPKQAQ